MPRSISIATIVISTLVTLATLLLGIVGTINYSQEKERQWSLLDESLTLEAEEISIGLSPAVWNIDRPQIIAVMESFLSDRKLYGIVVNTAGQTFAFARDAAWKVQPVDGDFPKTGLILKQRNISFGKEIIGKVQLFATPQFIEQDLRDRFRSTLYTILLLDLILILVLSLLFWGTVLNPLRSIEQYAIKVSTGQSVASDIKSARFYGELGTLRSAIESMVRQLDERYAAMVESENWYRALFNGSNDAIFVRVFSQEGENSTFVQVNDAACRRLGYSREELLSLTPTDLDPTIAGETSKELRRQLADQGSVLLESNYRAKDGHSIPVELNVHLFTLGGEQLVLAIARDITERKRNEEALQQVSERLQLATRAAEIGIWDWDIINNILIWDDTMYSLYGIRREEFSGAYEAWSNALHPEDKERTEREIQAAFRGEREYSSEFRIVLPDNSVRYLKAASQLFCDDQSRPIRMLGANWDFTTHKLAETEIRQLKNYLTNIIDSMPAILVGIDPNESVTQWNREAEAVTGISAVEAIGKQVMVLLPEFASWIRALKSEIKEGRPSTLEKLLLVQNEERHFYDFMLYPLEEEGMMRGAVIMIEDVTERARTQEMMVQTEKMMSVGGLAAGMAHEINNPLGIITQAAQNIERRLSPDLPANRKIALEVGVDLDILQGYFIRREIPAFIRDIQEAVSRAAKIVTNMLQFSRKSETVKAPANLGQILEQTVALAANDYDLKKKYDFRAIEIVREFDPDLPAIPVVAVEIEQVFLNLLKNAAQAMKDNPPERSPRITLRARSEGRYAVVEVEDNGPGMEEKVLGRVFEPFFTTKEPGVGTGLGLSVSYIIIAQNHKGMLNAESSPGNGACFSIRLPFAEQEEG